MNNIKEILEEMKTSMPLLKKGMIFETINSIYPTPMMDKFKKNISYKNVTFTKPLACNKKDKENFLKEDSPLKDFFKETSRGDFLEVLEIKGEYAICKNCSMKKEILNEFYKNEKVIISNYDIIIGNVKIYRRKIDKFFNDAEE